MISGSFLAEIFTSIHNNKRNRLTPSRAHKLVSVYQNNQAVRKFMNKDDADEYEAEVMAMLHDEQCLSASDDEWTVDIVMRRLMQKHDLSCNK